MPVKRKDGKSNYWAQRLGFDEADGAAREDPRDPSAVGTKAARADDVQRGVEAASIAANEQKLEEWLAQFEARMAAKEELKYRRAKEQRERDAAIDDERELLRKERLKQETDRTGGGGFSSESMAIEDVAEAKRSALERRAAEEAERRAMDEATSHLSPEEKQAYLDDIKELAELESAMATRTSRMSETGQKISVLVSAYEARLKHEQAARDAEEAAEAEAWRLFEQSQLQQRLDLVFEEGAQRSLVSENGESAEWADMIAAEQQARRDAMRRTRLRGYAEASEQDRGKADLLAPAHGTEWNEFVDELLELERLKTKLRRYQ